MDAFLMSWTPDPYLAALHSTLDAVTPLSSPRASMPGKSSTSHAPPAVAPSLGPPQLAMENDASAATSVEARVDRLMLPYSTAPRWWEETGERPSLVAIGRRDEGC